MAIRVAAGSPMMLSQVETLLHQICPHVQVTPAGWVSLGLRAHPVHSDGCECLDSLVNMPQRVIIHPLPGPNSLVPRTPRKKISDYGGGATQYDQATGSLQYPPGGGPPVSGAGSDSDVYVDISDNNGLGYSVNGAHNARLDAPLFIILFHELCDGHAYLASQGRSDPRDVERDPIASENAFRASQTPPYSPRWAGGGCNQPGQGRGRR